MTEGLILLVAVASVVGLFFLAMFTVLARRERRAVWKLQTARLSTQGGGQLQVFWRVAGVVLIGVVILVASSYALWRSRACTGRIVVIAGPGSVPTECVCNGGRLGTCFPSGP